MLILSRHKNEEIVVQVGETEVVVMVADIRGDKVRIGISAPPEVIIHRREVVDRIKAGEVDRRTGRRLHR